MPSPAPSRLELPPLIRGLAWLALLLGSSCANQLASIRSQSPGPRDVQLVQNSKRPDRNRGAASDSRHMGPMERALKRSSWDREKANAVANGDAFSIEGLHEYQAAESLYLEGRLPEAEKAFKKLAKSRRNNHETFGAKVERWWGVKSAVSYDAFSNFGDPIEEDALFMKSECQFEQQKYAAAQDSYDALLSHYPSTRHLDAVSRRYFQIARYWLGFPETVNETGDVELVSDSDEEPQDFTNVDSFYIPILPNFLDKTRPAFDTRGRALQALRSVWLHDATGPLADDALMVSASFHLRTKDFEESARLYKMLREQYPDSPHFRDAFLLGSHVTLASYQGSNYDGQSLGEAIQLKESALRIFPDLTEEERNRLGGELQKMYDAEVARIWDRVEYFQAKNADESVALYCNMLINRFPDTVYAERSRKVLEQQAAATGRRMSLPQLPSRKAQIETSGEGSAEAAEPAPRWFPQLWWPAKPIKQTKETEEPVEEAAEDKPEFKQTSAQSGRAKVE